MTSKVPTHAWAAVVGLAALVAIVLAPAGSARRVAAPSLVTRVAHPITAMTHSQRAKADAAYRLSGRAAKRFNLRRGQLGQLSPKPQLLRRAKARVPAVGSTRWFAGSGGRSWHTAYFAGLSALGVSAVDMFATGHDSTPPDPNGAVGANRYVEAVNSRI